MSDVISIHALREEGDQVNAAALRAGLDISIHALREEGDRGRDFEDFVIQVFLSTPSARRATCANHADLGSALDFYPRPPRGGRQQKRRKTSPLLFHYKTICTDLEELVQKHPKKQL